ncbi:MAG: hypothetical protein AB3N11_15890 [Arenibacterium sp.]
MKVDYLISGAGASGLSFLDVLLSESDATVAIIDRRDAPGGHWNDAYPFVRLHQSSSFYGVCSRPMNAPRGKKGTFDPALYELSSKSEVLHYFHDLMENEYLPTGRVTYLPMSEHLGGGKVRNLLSGDITEFQINKKLVEAGRWGDLGSIPATHERPYEVAESIECVPPNALPQRAAGHDNFTVVGAGKTGMDAIVWLINRGVSADRITWVRPSDYWMFQRENILNHPDFFETTVPSLQAEMEALGTVSTVDEYCERMEASGLWHRIDPDIWPSKFHAAVCSRVEMEALRKVRDIIRMGHLKRIETGRLILAEGDVAVPPGKRLYVDCTARAGAILGKGAPPVFDGDTINLFMIRPFQPLFSAALIAFLETNVPDDAVRQACTRLVNFHDTPKQYIAQQLNAIMNQGAWNQVPPLKAWINTCRLYAINHILAGITPDQTDRMATLGRFGPLSKAAAENIPRILAAKP